LRIHFFVDAKLG